MFTSSENQAYAAFAFISCFLILVPSPLHWKVRNTGTLLMIFWGFLGILNSGINSLAFDNSTSLKFTFGCDVSAVIDRIWQIGMLASCLCVLIRLEQIASTRQAGQTRSDLRRRLCLDFCLGVGIPCAQIPLYFIVQGHRLDVVENLGCQAPIYMSVPAVFLYYLWGFALAFVNIIYTVLISRWFIIRRRQFCAVLQASNSKLSQSKYLRLLAMTASINLIVLPMQIALICTISGTQGLKPYNSWTDVHADFNTIWAWPMSEGAGFSASTIRLASATRWLKIIPGLFFFAFFGLTAEARLQYTEWLRGIATIGRRKRQGEPGVECGDIRTGGCQGSDSEKADTWTTSWQESDSLNKLTA